MVIDATNNIMVRPDILGIFVTLLLSILGGIFWIVKMLYSISGRTTNNEDKIDDLDQRMDKHDGCSLDIEVRAIKKRNELLEQDFRQMRTEIQVSFDKYNNQNREDFKTVFSKIDDINKNLFNLITKMK